VASASQLRLFFFFNNVHLLSTNQPQDTELQIHVRSLAALATPAGTIVRHSIQNTQIIPKLLLPRGTAGDHPPGTQEERAKVGQRLVKSVEGDNHTKHPKNTARKIQNIFTRAETLCFERSVIIIYYLQ
jgi:hypothetical protein